MRSGPPYHQAVQAALDWIALVRNGHAPLPSGFQDLDDLCEVAADEGSRFDQAALRQAFRLDWIMRARRSASG